MRELEVGFSVSPQLDKEGKEQSASNWLSLERGTCVRLRGIYLLQEAKPLEKEKKNKGEINASLKQNIHIYVIY